MSAEAIRPRGGPVLSPQGGSGQRPRGGPFVMQGAYKRGGKVTKKRSKKTRKPAR